MRSVPNIKLFFVWNGDTFTPATNGKIKLEKYFCRIIQFRILLIYITALQFYILPVMSNNKEK